LTKVGKYVWIKIGKEMAKFHQNVLSMSENIAKTFFFGGGYFFDSHCTGDTYTWTVNTSRPSNSTVHITQV